jgi:hypothetical protein
VIDVNGDSDGKLAVSAKCRRVNSRAKFAATHAMLLAYLMFA